MATRPFTSIQLPSGRWQGGFRHPVTRRKVTKTFDYSYEADAWAIIELERAQQFADSSRTADTHADTSQATAPPPVATAPTPRRWIGPTVGEYGADWLSRRSVERATKAAYSAHLSGLAVPVHPDRPAPASVPMGLLTRAAVEQWVTDSEKAGIGRPTINGRLRLLRSLYADLFDSDEHRADVEGLWDPTRRIRYLTEDQAPDYILSRAEETDLLNAAGGVSEQLRAAILVALDAGLRWQEVYALRVSSVIHLGTGEGAGDYLMVSHVIERGRVELRAFTKGKKPRVVPMTDRLVAELTPLITAARRRGGPDALLFPATGNPDRVRKDRRDDLLAGRIPWDYGNHRKREWLPVLAAIGAAEVAHVPTGRTTRKGKRILQRRITEPAYGFHALRHTYGSRLAAAGVPRSEIKELMGHADERTTGRYIHAGDDGRRLALVRAALDRPAA